MVEQLIKLLSTEFESNKLYENIVMSVEYQDNNQIDLRLANGEYIHLVIKE